MVSQKQRNALRDRTKCPTQGILHFSLSGDVFDQCKLANGVERTQIFQRTIRQILQNIYAYSGKNYVFYTQQIYHERT